MSTTTQRAEVPTTALSGHGAKTAQRITWLIVFAALLGASIIASLLFGSNNSISLQAVLDAFNGTASPQTSIIVFEQRIPRTIVGITCGAALAVAGSLMQSLTRNPLAEPGLMGVNAGAAVAVVLSVFIGGVMGIWQYMAVAVIGAAIAAAAVYVLGRGKDGSIVKLALAGVAISAALGSFTQGLILINQDAYNEFRLWVAGSLEGRGVAIAVAIGPVIAAGECTDHSEPDPAGGDGSRRCRNGRHRAHLVRGLGGAVRGARPARKRRALGEYRFSTSGAGVAFGH